MKNIILILTTLLIYSCDKINFEESTNETQQVTANKEQQKTEDQQNSGTSKPIENEKPNFTTTFDELRDSFSHEVIALEKPFSYSVNFKWVPYVKSYKLRIKEGNSIVTESKTDLGFFSFKSADNKKLNFTLEVVDEEDRVTYAFLYFVTTPRDFVVNKESRVLIPTEKTEKGSVYRYNRVFLSKSQSLLILDKVNFVEINHLYSENENINVIENVDGLNSRLYKAEKNQDGLPANQLYLAIKNLYGRILIMNKGQDGGDGTDGQLFTDRAATGSPAVEGDTETVGKNDRLVCVTQGKPGGQGATGSIGRNGTNGRNGGNSGKVSVKIENVIRNDTAPIIDDIYSDQINPVTVVVSGGAKGLKGKGGEGQLGGLGGPAKSGKCTDNAKQGPEGQQGPRGKDGIDGQDGIREKYCVSVTSLGINYCE